MPNKDDYHFALNFLYVQIGKLFSDKQITFFLS